jgi:Putative Ig domain
MNKKLIAVAAAVAGVLTFAGVALASTPTPTGWPSGKPMLCVQYGTNDVVFNYARNSYCGAGTYPLDGSGYVPGYPVTVPTPAPSPSPDVITVTKPLTQKTDVDTAVNLQIQASDSVSSQVLTYTAALSIDKSTGLISGTTNDVPETYSVTVTVADTTGVSSSVTFTWDVVS